MLPPPRPLSFVSCVSLCACEQVPVGGQGGDFAGKIVRRGGGGSAHSTRRSGVCKTWHNSVLYRPQLMVQRALVRFLLEVFISAF